MISILKSGFECRASLERVIARTRAQAASSLNGINADNKYLNAMAISRWKVFNQRISESHFQHARAGKTVPRVLVETLCKLDRRVAKIARAVRAVPAHPK